MRSARETLRGSAGTVIAGVVVVGGLLALYFSIFGGGPSAQDASRLRTFIDAETGKPFKIEIDANTPIPCKSPDTGHMTGYEAAACYWTKDGHVKEKPTYVLTQEMLGKPGPTFCPDCGRLVSQHAARPSPGDRPPPTEEQYQAMMSGR